MDPKTGAFSFSSTDKIGVPVGDYVINITGKVSDSTKEYSNFVTFSFSIANCDPTIPNPPQIPALKVHYLGEGMSKLPWTFLGIAPY